MPSLKLKKSDFQWGSTTFPCFFCDVDSTELKVVVFGVIGALVIATLFSAIGLYLKGAFKDPEKLNDYPLKCEQEDNLY